MKRRPIQGSTVVVVGATCGVGRATALSLAAARANLVVMSRDPDDVARLAEDCGRLGSRAVGVAGDIARPEDLSRLAARALEEFGVIDTWINAASALIVGDLVDQPPADIARLVETNVLGTALASRTAIEHLAARGGVLINVSSLLGVTPNPRVPTYVMSKFAVRGLSLSLHAATSGSNVRVCTVLPGPVDTPLFQHAANYSGRAIRAIPPATSAERAAAAVIRSVRRPRRQRVVALSGALIMTGHRLAPRLTDTVVARASAALLVRSVPAGATQGSLHHSAPPTRVGGGWRRLAVRAWIGDALGRSLARRP